MKTKKELEILEVTFDKNGKPKHLSILPESTAEILVGKPFPIEELYERHPEMKNPQWKCIDKSCPCNENPHPCTQIEEQKTIEERLTLIEKALSFLTKSTKD